MYISCVYSYGIMLLAYEVIALNVCVCLCMMPYSLITPQMDPVRFYWLHSEWPA